MSAGVLAWHRCFVRLCLTALCLLSLMFWLLWGLFRHAFELPLMIAGLPPTAPIQRAVTGEGLKPPLVFSQKAVQFGLQVYRLRLA
jgi:hypothetical protein